MTAPALYEQRQDEMVTAVFYAAWSVMQEWDDLEGSNESWIEDSLDCELAEDLHQWLVHRVAALGNELRQAGYANLAAPVDPEERVVAGFLDHLRAIRLSHRSVQTVLNGGDTSRWLDHDSTDMEKLASRVESLSSSWRWLVRFLAAELGIEARLLDESEDRDRGEAIGDLPGDAA